MKIGIFYGSCGGTTAQVANLLADAFEIDEDDVINMEEDFDDVSQLMEYDVLFIGSSTWGQGDVQRDWVDVMLEIEEEELDFDGKTIALFGAGDSKTHGEHFVSALGKMHDLFAGLGAKIIGFVPTDGYTFTHSLALKDGKFCGLPFDTVNEPDLTIPRANAWIEQLKKELGL
jgi:flavodoxin I